VQFSPDLSPRKAFGANLILLAPLVPIVAELLAVACARLGYHEPGTRVVLAITVALLVILSVWAARSLRAQRAAFSAARDALQDSEARLAQAVATFGLGIIDHDPIAGTTTFSPQLEKILGLDPGQLDVETWRSSLLAEDRVRSVGQVQREVAQGLAEGPGDVRIRRTDGEVRELHGVRRYIYAETGEVRRIVATFHDVTEQNRDRAARDSLARALDLSPCMVRSLDGVIEYWPRGCEALYGWSATEAVGRRAQELLKIRFPLPYEEIIAALRRDGEWTDELYKETRDGAVRCVAAHWVLDDRGSDLPPRIVESVTDITDLKATGEALRDAQDRLAQAMTSYGLGIFDFDPLSRKAVFSEGMERIAGVGQGELGDDMGRWRAMVVPDDLDEMLASVAAEMAGRVEKSEHLTRITRPDGETRRVRLVRQYHYDAAGQCHRMTSLCMDVTAQQDAVDALRESEARLAEAVAAYELGIFDHDWKTGVTKVSAELAKITGYEQGTADELTVLNMIHPEDREHVGRSGLELRRLRQKRNAQKFRIIRADGEVRHLEGVTSYVYAPNGEESRSIGIYKDVTDRVVDQAELKAQATRLLAIQAELTHVSRLSAMGEMAAALAHELNQPLTAVGASVGAIGMLMAGDAPIDGPLRQRILRATALAEAQAVRAGEIVRRLRQFIVRGEADARIEDVEALIDDALALALPNPAASNIEVQRRGSPGRAMVFADRVQIQQILVNLIRNAVEAMGAQTTPRMLTLSSEIQDDLAMICVADTGPGVAAEVASRLFTPFTSTKHDGMGVGLSICRRIAESHGGTLWLEETDSPGTSFRFTLPLACKMTHHE